MYPGLFIFPLPPKDKFIFTQKEDSITVLKRKQGIVNFLEVILSHETISKTEDLRDFMMTRQKQEFTKYLECLQSKVNERSYVIKLKKQGKPGLKAGVKDIAKAFWNNPTLNLSQVYEDQFGRYANFVSQEIN